MQKEALIARPLSAHHSAPTILWWCVCVDRPIAFCRASSATTEHHCSPLRLAHHAVHVSRSVDNHYASPQVRLPRRDARKPASGRGDSDSTREHRVRKDDAREHRRGPRVLARALARLRAASGHAPRHATTCATAARSTSTLAACSYGSHATRDLCKLTHALPFFSTHSHSHSDSHSHFHSLGTRVTLRSA